MSPFDTSRPRFKPRYIQCSSFPFSAPGSLLSSRSVFTVARLTLDLHCRSTFTQETKSPKWGKHSGPSLIYGPAIFHRPFGCQRIPKKSIAPTLRIRQANHGRKPAST